MCWILMSSEWALLVVAVELMLGVRLPDTAAG